MRGLEKNWKSFFEASKSYQESPEKFTGRPSLPKYKHKSKGRNLLVYTIQAISKPNLREGIVKLSQTNIAIPTKCISARRRATVKNIVEARIIPRIGQYIIEIVYEIEENRTVNNPHLVAAIDIGVDNLAALTSNHLGFLPILVNGRPLKSINQFYNKTIAKLKAKLSSTYSTSRRIRKLTAKRNNQVDNYLHNASRWIINYLDKRGISKLIIGQNRLWKQEINNGKKNNQSFTSIPHARFVEMLIYKGAMKGIEVITSEESYTSRASFLSLDPIPNYGDDDANSVVFSGYRETRGIYKLKGKKIRINADVNASYNIMRKVIPTVFNLGIEGAVVRPIRVTPNRAKG